MKCEHLLNGELCISATLEYKLKVYNMIERVNPKNLPN